MQANTRLTLSPNYAFMLDYRGRPFIEQQVEPVVQYWVTPTFRELLSRFVSGNTVEGAIREVSRVRPLRDGERRGLLKEVTTAMQAGLLVPPDSDPSMYTQSMLKAYTSTRTIPADLVGDVIRHGKIGKKSHVLDVGAGPGLLSLPLARVAGSVTAMDISRAFLAEVRRRARKEGLPLTTFLDSGSRLRHREEKYDVVTMCQSLHWLDDIAAMRGAHHVLRPGGQVFVIYSSGKLAKRHPLLRALTGTQRDLFTDRTYSGPRYARYLRKLAAAAAPITSDTELRPVAVRAYRERRVFDLEFARGYFTPAHASDMDMSFDALWKRIEQEFKGARAEDLKGETAWTTAHFQLSTSRAP